MSFVPMHKFGYTEEVIQTGLLGDMKNRQESHEKLSHTKIETNENHIIKQSTKMIYLEKKMLDCETMLDQFRDILSNTVNDEENIKNIVQFSYNIGLFDIFPNKDQVFESYLKFNDYYLLMKCEK